MFVFQGNFTSSEPFPLPNVPHKILDLLIQWMDKHQNEPVVEERTENRERSTDEFSLWDREFVGALDRATLFEIINAANYLEIQGLLDLASTKISSMIVPAMGKTVEEKAKTPKKQRTVEDQKTAEGKTTEDKEKKIGEKKKKAPSIMLPPTTSSAEPLFGSQEMIPSKENLSKESTFEYEDPDFRTLEKDALDVDSSPSLISGDLIDAPEFSARDAEGEPSNKPDPRAALKKKLSRIVKNVTKKKYAGNFYKFNYNDITKTIRMVKSIFMKEPAQVSCKAPAVIVGDIHGQYTDLLRIFSCFNEGNTPGYYTSRYVFLGDYVDRGKQSIEVLMLCFWLKIMCPKQFILLRGNHEFRAINRTYGFYAELKARFPGMQSEILFESFNDCFMHFPLCCFVAGNILCMHGGISSKMVNRDVFKTLPKPLRDSKDHPIACDLMWADPMIGLTGEKRNNVRGVSVYFGEDQLEKTMGELGIKLVVRGHQMMQNGFNFFHGFKLATVFSASSYYPDKPNKGAVMCVTKEGRIGFKSFAPLPKDHPAVKGGQVFRDSHDQQAYEDGGHAVFKPDEKKK